MRDKIRIIGVGILLCLTPLGTRGEAGVTVTCNERWSNIFSQSNITFHITIESSKTVDGTVAWRISSNNRTIRSGDIPMRLNGGEPQVLEMPFVIPEIREGITIDAALDITFIESPSREQQASLHKPLRIFSDNPFTGNQTLLEKLNIHLFDPEDKTAEILEAAEVPFTRITNIDALSELGQGMLIVGAGVSFDDYKGLWDIMVSVAASGTPVFCLAPQSGDLSIPGININDAAIPLQIAMKRRNAITQLDKHLDSDEWFPGDKDIVASSITPSIANRSATTARIEEGRTGWPWMEISFDDQDGRIILCGFDIVDQWGQSPTPRFLFMSVIKDLNSKSNQKKGTNRK